MIFALGMKLDQRGSILRSRDTSWALRARSLCLSVCLSLISTIGKNTSQS